ncbi:hypothetical protein TNCV_3189471 [Trichonephila clavipes]|nr:hypothetical protein TNCV_3189471 [Trichonephila clavipes]
MVDKILLLDRKVPSSNPLSVICKGSIVTAVYCEARYTNRLSASNGEELLYRTTKDRVVHRRQPLRIVVVEDRQWRCHVERSPTPQRQREKKTLYRSVADYPTSRAGY